MDCDKIRLSQLPRALRERGVTVSYQMAWRRANEGVIPVERVGPSWWVRVDDLPEIAAFFAAKAGAQ